MDQNVKKNPLFFNVAWNEIIKFLLRLVYFFDGISLYKYILIGFQTNFSLSVDIKQYFERPIAPYLPLTLSNLLKFCTSLLSMGKREKMSQKMGSVCNTLIKWKSLKSFSDKHVSRIFFFKNYVYVICMLFSNISA